MEYTCTYKDFFDVVQGKLSFRVKELLTLLEEHIKKQTSASFCLTENTKNRLQKLLSYMKKKWQESRRIKNQFLNKNENWLKTSMTVEASMPANTVIPLSSPSTSYTYKRGTSAWSIVSLASPTSLEATGLDVQIKLEDMQITSKQQGNGTWRQEAPPPRNTVLHEDQISGDVVDDLYQEEGSLTSSLDIKLEHEEVTETEAQDVRALSIRSKHSDEVYCRLCLEQTTKSTYLPLGDIDLNYPDETEEFKNVKQKQIDEVQTMINMCFPFYEPLTFNPVVCSNCISQLKRCYEFTAKVTQNQQLINTYINTSGATENLVNITDIVHSKLNQDVDNSFHRKTDSINTLSQKDTQESAITPIPGQKRVHEHEIESGFASVGKKQKTALHIQDDYDITVKQEPIDPLEHDLDISQNVLDTTDIKVELDYIDTPDLIKTEMEEQFQDTTHLDQSGLSGHSIHPNNTLDKETSFSSPGGTSENLMVHSSKKQRIKK